MPKLILYNECVSMRRYISFAILVLLFIITFVITQNSLYPLKANIPSDASSVATTIIVPGMAGPTYTFTIPPTVTAAPGPTSTITTVIPISPIGLYHRSFTVSARDFTRYYIGCCKNCDVFIDFLIIRSTLWGYEWSDIIFRVISPDGREIFPRYKIYKGWYLHFVADQEGTYILEFDNTYSDSNKYIDLAVSVMPSLQTITITSYKTLTTTFTATAIYIFERTIPILTTSITTSPVTIREVVERTTTVTSTITEKFLDIPILILIAILLLAIGILIGYLIKRGK
jgi:hypothetical protein